MARKGIKATLEAKLKKNEELTGAEARVAAMLGLHVGRKKEEAPKKKTVRKKVVEKKRKKRGKPAEAKAAKAGAHVVGSLDTTAPEVPLTKKAERTLSIEGVEEGKKFGFNSPKYRNFVQTEAKRQRKEAISAGKDVPALGYYEYWIDTMLANEFRRYRPGKRWE